MDDFLVDARDLGMAYASPGVPPVEVLDGATCSISPNDRIAIVGPSGSGKSTLMHILGGLLVPSRGRISWPALGARSGLMPTRVQFVFQSPSLFPALDVLGNITLPLFLAGREKEAKARAHSLLETFDLADLAEKLPEELSGGQAQRIAMLRALATGPRLILADEPTGQLDSKTSEAFLEAVLKQATSAGIALVIATHDHRVADRMGNLWTMDHGNLRTHPGAAIAREGKE